MEYFSSDFTLGILGGGQLGKMMLYETRKWDIRTKVMDASEEAPCKIACDKFVKGSLLDFDAVYNFGKDVDVLTIEIENVNLDALEKLEEAGKKFIRLPLLYGLFKIRQSKNCFTLITEFRLLNFIVSLTKVKLKIVSPMVE